MRRINARVKAKARINIHTTIIRARQMTNASASADVHGRKPSLLVGVASAGGRNCKYDNIN